MNIKLVLKLVGRVLVMETAALTVPLAVALLYRESPAPFLLSIAIVAAVGLVLSTLPAKTQFFTREGFVAVGLIWIFTGVVGALPFLFSGYFATLPAHDAFLSEFKAWENALPHNDGRNIILFKGSRGNRLEKLVKAFRETHAL